MAGRKTILTARELAAINRGPLTTRIPPGGRAEIRVSPSFAGPKKGRKN